MRRPTAVLDWFDTAVGRRTAVLRMHLRGMFPVEASRPACGLVVIRAVALKTFRRLEAKFSSATSPFGVGWRPFRVGPNTTGLVMESVT